MRLLQGNSLKRVTDDRTDGRTHPLFEMLGRTKKYAPIQGMIKIFLAESHWT